MDSFPTLVGVLVVLLAISCVLAAVYSSDQIRQNPFLDRQLLQKGMDRPVIWIYYDNSEVNARQWSDFGARSDRALHIPFLNLCYQSIVHHHKDLYRVEVIGGLQDLSVRLGADALPESLRNPLASVGEAEEDWIRSAVLARFGGLWLSPSVVCLCPFGLLGEKVVAFGQDSAPMYGSGRLVPGFRALWSPAPEHPLFVEWETRCRERLEGQLGGRQFRGDAKSDWKDLAAKHGAVLNAGAELSRDPQTGKKLELEDILAVGTEGNLPFDLPEKAVYVVVPAEDLRGRRAFGWFLRMSEGQIMESDLVVRYLLEEGLKPVPVPSSVPVVDRV